MQLPARLLHIDNEAIFYVTLQHASEGAFNLFASDHFDVGGDVVLAAEVEHLLRFANAADGGAANAQSTENHRRDVRRRMWPIGNAHQNQLTVGFQGRQIGIKIVRRGDAVENNIQ